MKTVSGVTLGPEHELSQSLCLHVSLYLLAPFRDSGSITGDVTTHNKPGRGAREGSRGTCQVLPSAMWLFTLSLSKVQNEQAFWV